MYDVCIAEMSYSIITSMSHNIINEPHSHSNSSESHLQLYEPPLFFRKIVRQHETLLFDKRPKNICDLPSGWSCIKLLSFIIQQ